MKHWYDFSQKDWQNIEISWKKWWNHELDRSLLVLEATDPIHGADFSGLSPHLTQYDLSTPENEILDKIEQQLNRIDYIGDAFPKWFPNFGAGFMAAFFGSEPEFNNGTTWFHPSNSENLVELKKPINKNQIWYQRLLNFYQEASKRWAGKINLGYTDIGGNLDTLASLLGSQRILADLMDHPDEIESWCQQITDRWLEFHHQIHELLPEQQIGQTGWAPIWAPGTTYMLQCDLSIMISPKMFNKYVMPDLEACCEAIEYPFYHLDGPGATRHLDSLLSIDKLRGIQWIPGAGAPPAEEWLPLLEKIRNAGKLCQVYVTVEGAVKIARTLGQKGFLFCIGDARLPTPQEAQICLEQFDQLN